jgi:hypothetical protein
VEKNNDFFNDGSTNVADKDIIEDTEESAWEYWRKYFN